MCAAWSAEVNRLAPDLVLMTGDYISNTPRGHDFAYGAIYRCADLLRELACPLRFAVDGQPRLHPGRAQHPRRRLRPRRIPLLVNQHVAIERAGERLWLAAIADPLINMPDLNAAIPANPDGPVLLLCHAPDYADYVLAHPRGALVDLMLAGHSHGGQVRLPIVGAAASRGWRQKIHPGALPAGQDAALCEPRNWHGGAAVPAELPAGDHVVYSEEQLKVAGCQLKVAKIC